MAIKIIGKSVLGETGFCQVPQKMGENYYGQLESIIQQIPYPYEVLVMTSMTGQEEIQATNGEYFPKIRLVDKRLCGMYNPILIYHKCKEGKDKLSPGSDFLIWNSLEQKYAVATFSREAPILAFESNSGIKSLGVILRPSLMKYGDYLFSTIKEALGGDISVTVVTCNHFEYDTGSIPNLIKDLASKYDMTCIIGENSEKNTECYHRGETGNHVVVMW